MALLKNGKLVKDLWRILEDGEDPLRVENPLISLGTWKANKDSLGDLNRPLGIRLQAEEPAEEIGASMDRFSLIAVDFPIFSDGRGLSSARLLRERYGYQNELRAIGDIRRDQYLFLLRCGFDSFEVKEEIDLDEWSNAAKEVSVFYQPATDESPWVVRRRHP